jgi:2',3'-cyclic-nucleotide 2'-phosphodiesterase (5'-nucleotidase family)
MIVTSFMKIFRFEQRCEMLWATCAALLTFSLFCTPVLGTFKVAQDGSLEITIAYTSDIHSHLYPEWTDEGCKGGMPLLATKIAQLRSERPVLLLDCGDILSGGGVNDLNKGQPMIEIMNAIGYDAMALDNHEFDQGLGALNDMITSADFDILSANTKWPDAVQSGNYSIEEIAGFRIGVIGLTQSFWYAPEEVVFRDLDEVASEMVAELESQGVNFIIVLGASVSVPNVDLCIMGAPSYASALRVLNLKIDTARGSIEHSSSDEMQLDSSIQPNATVEAIIEKWNAPLADVLDKPVGWFDADHTRSDVGPIMAAAVRNFTGADLGLYNLGGVRDKIPKGFVTYRSLYHVEPFFDHISTFEVLGDTAESLTSGYYYDTDIMEFDSETIYTIASSNFTTTEIELYHGEAIIQRTDYIEDSVIAALADYLSKKNTITGSHFREALHWSKNVIESLTDTSFKGDNPAGVRVNLTNAIDFIVDALDDEDYSQALELIQNATSMVCEHITDSCPRRWINLNLNCILYCLSQLIISTTSTTTVTTTSTSIFSLNPLDAIIIIGAILIVLISIRGIVVELKKPTLVKSVVISFLHGSF